MVGILIVSHSEKAALGIAEIASQMCGGAVPVAAVGGAEGGGLGTSVPAILKALQILLEQCDDVLLLPDLGSSVLSAGAALEFLGDAAARVTMVDAPVLEGAMVGAVEASIGSPVSRVAAVAREARNLKKFHES